MKRALPVLIGVLLLAGCAATTSATHTAKAGPPADGGSYGSVLDLKDAYVAAGGQCSEWDQTNAVTLAAESGSCSRSVVLSTYASSDDKQEVIGNIKVLMKTIGGVKLLVGKNWILNSDSADKYRAKLGGTIVDSTTE